MNKTQINWAIERIHVVAKQKEFEIQEETPFVDTKFTDEEKISLILSGKAILRKDDLLSAEKGKCPSWLNRFLQGFKYPGEEKLAEKAEIARAKKAKAIKQIKLSAEEYIDKIILDGVAEAKAIKEFRARKFTVK